MKKLTLLLPAMLVATAVAVWGAPGAEQTASDQVPTLSITMTDSGIQYVEGLDDVNEDKYIKELERLTGFDLDFRLLPWHEYDQALALVFAAGEYTDVVQVPVLTDAKVAPAIEAGVFMPLNDLIQMHAPLLRENVPAEIWDDPAINQDGTIYAIPKLNSLPNPIVMYVRRDWIEDCGLSAPRTIEEYLDVYRSWQECRPNGVSEPIPYSSRAQFITGEAFFGAYDVLPRDWRYVDGELVPNFIRPEMKDALLLYRSMYEEGLLDSELFTQTGPQWDAKIKGEGVIGSWVHVAQYPDKWLIEVQRSHPDALVDVLPHPVGPDGKGGHSIGPKVNGLVYAIPTTNENPEAAIRFLDSFWSEEVARFLTYGIEGDNYTVENGEITYRYPTDQESVYEESMHQIWLNLIGGPSPIDDEEYVRGKPHGDLIFKAMDTARSEGRPNAGLGLPALPTMLERPELAMNGLFLEFASKVITGRQSIDTFEDFVEDWRSRGGDRLIEEATEWYRSREGM